MMVSSDGSSDQNTALVTPALIPAPPAGLSVQSALLALADQTPSARRKAGILRLMQLLEQGVSCTAALQDSGVELNDAMKLLIRSGIESGRMDGVMYYSIAEPWQRNELRHQIWFSLLYRIAIGWALVIFIGGFFVVFIPEHARNFEKWGIHAHGLSAVLVQVSTALNQQKFQIEVWRWLFSCWIVFSLAVAFAACSNTGQWIAVLIPRIHRRLRYAAESELCRRLALLLKASFPVAASLQIAGRSSRDKRLSQACESTAQALLLGQPIRAVAGNSDLPRALRCSLLNVNSTGELVDPLNYLAEIYAADCRSAGQQRKVYFALFTLSVMTLFIGASIIALIANYFTPWSLS